MKKSTELAPYHLFKLRDNNYAFHVQSSAVIRLDDPAFDALLFFLQDTDKDNLNHFLISLYDKDVCSSVISEINALESRGFFSNPTVFFDTKEGDDYIQEVVRRPISRIELFLSETCNLKCQYCFVEENNALNQGLMPWDIAKKAIDCFFDQSENETDLSIFFFGGEPLLNTDVLYSAVDYSQSLADKFNKNIDYSLTTNATIINDKIINFLRENDFSLMVSIDGPKDIHDQQRVFVNGCGTFDHVVKNVKELISYFPSLEVQSTLTRQYLNDRFRVLKFLEKFKFSNIGIAHCLGRIGNTNYSYNFGPDDLQEMRMKEEVFLDYIVKNLNKGRPVRYNPWGAAIIDIHYHNKCILPCDVGTNSLTVGVDGMLYPCDYYVGMDNYILGDVISGVNKEKLSDFLKNYLETKDKCQYCWAASLCGGYCPARLSKDNGSFGMPNDWWCDDILKWYEQAIWLFDTLKTEYPHYLKQLIGEECEET